MRLSFPSLAGLLGAGALVAAPTLRAGQTAQSVFRGDTRTVAVYATVHDREGRLVPDLTRDDFNVFDDGKLVPLTTFANDVLPFTAVFLLDMSDSFVPQYFRVVASAQKFVQNLSADDRLRIGTFGREVSLSPLLTGDKAVLARVLEEEVWPGGGTPLWRAAKTGMDSLVNEPGRRVILLLTDGVDRGLDFDCAPLVRQPIGPIGPCPGRMDVRAQAQDGAFMFYAIGMPGAAVDGGLIDIVETTGGGHFNVPHNADLDATFQRVTDELHHQYVLGFTPQTLDGRTHQLDVRLTRAGLVARARKSYLAKADRGDR